MHTCRLERVAKALNLLCKIWRKRLDRFDIFDVILVPLVVADYGLA